MLHPTQLIGHAARLLYFGATENAGVENAGALKMPVVENVGVEIAAP